MEDSSIMSTYSYRLYIERIDTSEKMARFYTLAIEPSLFGTPSLIRRWGRIGSRGNTMVHHFDGEREALRALLDILRAKRGREYRTKPLEMSNPHWCDCVTDYVCQPGVCPDIPQSVLQICCRP